MAPALAWMLFTGSFDTIGPPENDGTALELGGEQGLAGELNGEGQGAFLRQIARW